jgi:hypothetical protein
MPPPKISHDQIHDAVRRSGYLLEYRIERVLERSGYAPEANEVYPDPVTGKSRELDIAAISPEPITADYRNAIWTRLLIECVNNPQPIGFFVKDPSLPMTIFDLKFSGLPVKIKQKGRWWKISDYLDMEKYHHQCKGKISTQYCSFTPKKNTNPVEWLAQHEDAHFDSFNKLCFALNHEVDEHYSRAQLRGKESVNVQVYYPILVVSGEIVNITPTRKGLKIQSENHSHYVQSYITNGIAQHYHIDVVTEKYFPRLLTIIDKEMTKTARLMRRRQAVILKTIDQITASVKGLRSPQAIRSRMEYRGPWGTDDPS